LLVAAQTPDVGGISLFLVADPRPPRLTYEPIDMGFAMFENQFVVHLDDVQVGADAIVGKAGQGAARAVRRA